MVSKHFISSHRKRLQLLTQEHRMFSCRISDLFVQRWRRFFSCKSQKITYTSSEIEKNKSKMFTTMIFFFKKIVIRAVWICSSNRGTTGNVKNWFSRCKLNVMMNELIYRCCFEIFFFNLKVTVLLPVCQLRQGREEIVNLKCCGTKTATRHPLF